MRNRIALPEVTEFILPLQLLDEEFDALDNEPAATPEDGIVPHAPVSTGTEWDDESGISEIEMI